MKSSYLNRFLPVVLFAMTLGAHAASNTWVGTTNVWDDSATNWTSPATWISGDDAVFGTAGAGGLTLALTTVTAHNLTFNTTGYTLGGSTLTLNGTTPTVNVVTGIATISSIIDGAAGMTLVGAGKLILTGANIYTGDTIVSGQGHGSYGGDVSLTLNSTTGPAIQSSNLYLGRATNSGHAVIDCLANDQFGANTVVYVNGSNYAYINLKGTTQTIAGLSQFNGTANYPTIQSTESGASGVSTLNINTATGTSYASNGIFRNGGGGVLSIVKQGDGTQTLGGALQYTGSTTVSGGRLIISGNSLSSPVLSIASGGTLEISTTGTGASGAPTSISGAGTYQKTGNGLWDMTWGGQAKTISMASGGLIDVQGGTLRLGYGYNSNWTSNLGDLTIAGGAIFDMWDTQDSGRVIKVDALNGAGTVTDNAGNNTLNVGVDNGTGSFSGTITQGSGRVVTLIKSGSGTQTLSGTCNYTGTTTVNDGTLQVDGTLGNTAVTVAAPNGKLAGIGSIAGTVVVNGTIAPAGNAIGTLTVNNSLTLNTGSNTAMDINKTGATLTQDLLAGTGSVTFGGTLTVTATGDPLTVGNSFKIFNKATYSGGFSTINLPALTNGLLWDTSTLANNGTITVIAADATLPPSFSPPAGFYIGEQSVTITGDSGSTIHYTTDGTDPIDSVTVIAAASPVVGITVPVDALTTLRAYASRPDYADSTSVTAEYGTVTTPTWTGASSTLWQTAGNWVNGVIPNGSGVTADFGALALVEDSVVDVNTSVVVGQLRFGDVDENFWWTVNPVSGGSLTLAGGSRTITVDNGKTTFAIPVAGAAGLTKAGGGTLELAAANTYTGTTTVDGGKLILSTNSNSLSNGFYTIGNAGTLEINTGASNWTARNGLSFSGSTGILRKTGASALLLGGNDYATSVGLGAGGMIDIQGGMIKLDYGYNKSTWSANLASMNIAGGATFDIWDYGQYTGNFVKIDALTGAGYIDRGIGGTTTGGLEIGVNNGSGSFSGVIQNSVGDSKINLKKSGSGIQTLTGTNTYTGSTAVNDGKLIVDGSLGTTAVAVESGATLGGIGSIGGAVNVKAGAFVAPGNTGARTLTVASATLAGTYQCELDAATGDSVAVTGALTVVSGTTIAITAGSPEATSYTIATYGSLVGSFDDMTVTGMPSGYVLNTATAGQIKIVKATGYSSWINDYYPGETDQNIVGPNADPDNDGIPNAVEMVIGNIPDVNLTANLPTIELVTDPAGVPAGDYLLFMYRRSTTSVDAGLLANAEYDGDLVAPWATAIDGIDGVEIIETPNPAIPGHDVKVYVPRGSNTELFGRLDVTVPAAP